MIRLLLLSCLCFAFNAVAGYECDFALTLAEESEVTVATETITASDKDFKSHKVEDFFVESDLSQDTSISLNVLMNGWRGEEEATIEVFRRNKSVSEKVSFRGNEEDTLWFGNYKLDIKCSLV